MPSNSESSIRRIHITSPGHLAFALTFIGLGVMGLGTEEFTQVWNPVPKWVPAQHALARVCALLSLGCGVGLLVRRAASTASRILLGALLLWIVAFRLPNLFYEKPLVLVGWTLGATGVMTGGAWVLVNRFRGSDRWTRIARIAYGQALIPFGLAHFMYLDATTVLIPGWLPFHVALAYLTGAAFIAAGISVCFGVLAPLGSALSALQMGLFSIIVWLPRVFTGNLSEFQRGEVVSTIALTAGAWVVAESYRPLSSKNT